MKSPTKLKNAFFTEPEVNYNYMKEIPPKSGRYIVVDTETTGMTQKDHIVEIGAVEIINGKLTGSQFHVYLRPRVVMSQHVINIHKIENDFYDNNCKTYYEKDKESMEYFLNFAQNSLIFCHNAPFDMAFINSELRYWKLRQIEKKRFRCTMRIFTTVVSQLEPKYIFWFSLTNCCRYFNINTNEGQFHTALFDAFMAAKVMNNIYYLLDTEPKLMNNDNINYQRSSVDQFLLNYKKENSKNIDNDSSKDESESNMGSSGSTIENNFIQLKRTRREFEDSKNVKKENNANSNLERGKKSNNILNKQQNNNIRRKTLNNNKKDKPTKKVRNNSTLNDFVFLKGDDKEEKKSRSKSHI